MFGVLPDRARQVVIYTRGAVERAPVEHHLLRFSDSANRPPDRLTIVE
jgi:hypothetical protein